MQSYINFILKHRFLVLAVLVVVTVLAGWKASTASMSTRLGEDMMGDHPEFHSYLEHCRKFRSDSVVVIGLEDPDMLSVASLDRLAAVVTALEDMPDIANVDSILDAARMSGDGKVLKQVDYADEARKRPGERMQIAKDLGADPLAGELFVARDGKAHSVLVEFTVDEERSGERLPEIVADIRAAVADAGYAPEQIHLGGFSAAVAETMIQMQYHVSTLFPFVAVILLVTVWLLFRRLWPAAVTMAVSLMAVTWTVGFVVFLEGTVHALLTITPPVILLVAFSDVVHLCSAYLTALGQGMDKERAIRAAGVEVGKACFLTSATTLVGFASFSIVPQPAMRLSAIALAFGVTVALLLALTLVPILLSMFKQPKALRGGATAVVQTGLDRLLASAQRLSTTWPRSVTVVFALLGVLAVMGATGFTFDVDFDKRFDDENQLTVDAEWFEDNFLGTNTLEVYVRAPEGSDLLDPERFRAVAAYQEALTKLPGVGSTTSLVDLMSEVHLQMAPAQATEDPLPDSRKALAQYLLLFETSGGEGLDRIVDFNREEMLIGGRLNHGGARATAVEGVAARDLAPQYLGDLAEVEVTGLVFLLGYFFDEVIDSQRLSVLISFLLIALMMSIGLRSFRVGCLSMIPNLLPVITVAGWLGAFADRIDSDVMIVMVMAIGIGVDDTVHFLMRYRVELARGSDHDTAIRGAFGFAGRAIVMTTIILVAGFLPCAGADFITMLYLGTMLPLALVTALAADLLLVPALITLGVMKLPTAKER